ncbi:MAG: PD-(D/E)XK nuclease family protein [Lutimonas sp.]
MQSFISKVVQEEIENQKDFSSLIYILPSNRSVLFFKRTLIEKLPNQTILPKIYTIESFIQQLSGYQRIDSLNLLFEFYELYKQEKQEKSESFDQFMQWASILLSDFNEIDSHLADPKQVFSYLADLTRIDNSFQLENLSPTSLNYVLFIESFHKYYISLQKTLKHKKKGYSGLLYREADLNLEHYLTHTNFSHVFIGFNALNHAEEKIFQRILLNNSGKIYWDYDQFYLSTNIGDFQRNHKKWNYFQSHSFDWISEDFKNSKEIAVYSTPQDVGQVKLVGEILQRSADKEKNYQNTAIVLADEKLLPVLLNSLPPEVKNVNITMGLNLTYVDFGNLIRHFFTLHQNRLLHKNGQYVYKDIDQILNQNYITRLFEKSNIQEFQKHCLTTNKIYISYLELESAIQDTQGLFSILFDSYSTVESFIERILRLIHQISLLPTLSLLEKEYLNRFSQVFRQLEYYQSAYKAINDLKSLFTTFTYLLQQESISFKGEPLSGLQILGVLETRVLDFEQVIMTSVNEGILPAGKSEQSFLTFETKMHFNLPTYREKDKIFGYHFFRLLQRAEKAFLISNSSTSNFGAGEQSRFITQLEIVNESGLLPNLKFEKKLIRPNNSNESISLRSIPKSPEFMARLEELAISGFSPSSLTSYIRNPLDFYKQKILRLKELDELEENIAHNTFGTIVHEALYDLYLPFLGKNLTVKGLQEMLVLIPEVVEKQFQQFFHLSDFKTGQNFINFKVALKYIEKFILSELKQIESGSSIKILSLEEELKLTYFCEPLQKNIHLKGFVDRIDEKDEVIRIIDYKTGAVTKNDLKIKDWDLLITDEKYSKCFQVLFYAYIYKQNNEPMGDMESGIYSFKKLNSGFLKFNDTYLEPSYFEEFLAQLDLLLMDLFNPEINIDEKEIKTFFT